MTPEEIKRLVELGEVPNHPRDVQTCVKCFEAFGKPSVRPLSASLDEYSCPLCGHVFAVWDVLTTIAGTDAGNITIEDSNGP